MPRSGAPSISSGGRRSSRLSRRAPISRSGTAIRSTGRRRIESSPSRTQRLPSCPASQPGSSRSRVPALPTSIVADPAPRSPTPRMRTPRLGATRRSGGRPSGPGTTFVHETWGAIATSAPSAATASRVERVSAASRKAVISVSPSPIAAISAARWEIDLSEGGRSQPRRGPEGRKRVLFIETTLCGGRVDDADGVAELADQALGLTRLLFAPYPERYRPRVHVRGRVQGHVLDVD